METFYILEGRSSAEGGLEKNKKNGLSWVTIFRAWQPQRIYRQLY